MKNIFKLLILLFFVSILYTDVYAQVNTIIPNGYNRFYYPDKTLSAEGLMKDGKPIGYWKSYYPNAKLKAEGNRKGEQLDSIWKFYNEKGILKEIIDYKKGLRSGYNLQYKNITDSLGDRNILISKELFIEGKLNGKSYYYTDDGKLDYTVEYEKGYKNGFEKHYDSEGLINLILRYSYNNLTDNEYLNKRDKFGRKQGVWQDFFENEKIKTFSVYLNDTLNGYYRQYDRSGNIKESLFYRKGEIVNIAKGDSSFAEKEIIKTFYSNGKIKSVGAYVNDVKVGKHVFYDSLGNEENSVEFDVHGIATAEGYSDSRGYKQNDWNYLYPDGRTKAKGKYVDNKRVGEWKFYFPDGSQEQIGKYKNGKPSGNWKWFFDNSNIRREGNFVNGFEEGFFYELDFQRDTISSGKYVQGLKNGLWKIRVNDHLEIGSYTHGKRSGIWKYYYTDNVLEFEGSFIEDLEDGNHKYYYPNKRLKISAYYSGGLKTKKWKYYDKDGNLNTIIEYKYGKMYKIDGNKIKEN